MAVLAEVIKEKALTWMQIAKGSVFPGNGASTTKQVYLWTGICADFSAVVMTLTFCGVYIGTRKADPVFGAAVGAMWLAVFGFATSAQNIKAKFDKELDLATKSAEQKGEA